MIVVFDRFPIWRDHYASVRRLAGEVELNVYLDGEVRMYLCVLEAPLASRIEVGHVVGPLHGAQLVDLEAVT